MACFSHPRRVNVQLRKIVERGVSLNKHISLSTLGLDINMGCLYPHLLLHGVSFFNRFVGFVGCVLTVLTGSEGQKAEKHRKQSEYCL